MRKENPGREPVYLTKYHIVYWLNQMKPMRKVVHPANISEDIFNKVFFGPEASSQTEVIRLLEKKPRFIVKEMNTWYLEKKPKTKAILDKALYTDYVMVKKIDDAFIFKRKDSWIKVRRDFEKTDRIHLDFSIIDGVGRRMKRIFPGRVNIFVEFSAFAAGREANKVFLDQFNKFAHN